MEEFLNGMAGHIKIISKYAFKCIVKRTSNFVEIILKMKIGSHLSKPSLYTVKGTHVHATINGEALAWNTEKMVNVRFRPSIFHIKYPFIMELRYARRWTETVHSVVVVGKTTIPTTHYVDRETKDYHVKLLTDDHVKEWADVWVRFGVTVESKIDWLDDEIRRMNRKYQ